MSQELPKVGKPTGGNPRRNDRDLGVKYRDPRRTTPLRESDVTTSSNTGTSTGYRVIETPVVTDPNGRSIKSADTPTGHTVTERPIITDQYGRPIESTTTQPLPNQPETPKKRSKKPETTGNKNESQPTESSNTTPQPETTPQNINRPGYISPYETPKQKEERIKKTQEEIGDVNRLNPDGSNREEFNYGAFAYRDPNATKQSQNPEPTPPTPPEPTPQEVTVSREDGNQVKQTVLPGFDVTNFPEEPISGGPAVEVNPRMEPIGKDSQGNIIEQGNMFSLGKQKDNEQPNPEPVKEPEQPEGPIVLDTIIQQGTESELYSARIEAIRARGDEIEAANMGTYVNYPFWSFGKRFTFFVRNLPRAIKNGFERTRGEVQKGRELSEKDQLEVIFDSRSIEEARKLKDQIAQEGATLLANDLLSSAAKESKFEKVYESLEGNAEFEAAKAELVLLIKKYSVKDPKTGLFPDRESFEKEKNSIVEKIVKLAPESADKDALENTIDGFWNNVEVLRSKNLSAEKLAQMEIILNIKMARGSFLRQTEIQKNLSNELAETMRNTRFLSWMPVKYRDAISVAIPTFAAVGSRMLASPVTAWITFGVAPLASGLISGGVEKFRKLDETDTTRRILARDTAAGGDPREALRKYNPQQISATVNQININNITTNIEFALQDLGTLSADPNENNKKVQLLLDLLANYMSVTEQATKDKFDYFTAGSEQELIAGKAKAAQLALQIRNRISELKTAGSVSLDINSEFKTRYQKALADFEKSKNQNNELFEALQSTISTNSAIRKSKQAAVMSAVFGVFGFLGEQLAGAEEFSLGGIMADSLVDNIVEPGSRTYQELITNMGYDVNTSSYQLVESLNREFSAGVPDAAQPEFSGLAHATTTEQALAQDLTPYQLRGWAYEQMTGTQEVYHGITVENCDPQELVSNTERSLTVSEILSNPGKYPTQYSDIIRNGAYQYSGGHWDQLQIDGGEAWDSFLADSEVVDKSEIFSISDPALQVEAMGTETHSFWADADRNVLNITGRDFVKGPNGEFLEHTHRILEDGTKEYYREILPFNDFLDSKVESGNFDVMVYLKDGNVVRIPSEYISVTDNGVSVDFRNVPGIVGEIWKSGNLGLADVVRYGFTTDTGSHAMVSTIDLNGASNDISKVINEWNPGDIIEKTYSTVDTTKSLVDVCPDPDPIPVPDPSNPGYVIPVILFGPGASGKEERYQFKGNVNPEDGTISNERKLDIEKLTKVKLDPTSLKQKSQSVEFEQDLIINGKHGVVETLSNASIQVSAILEMLNNNDPKFYDAIMDSKRMLIVNLDILLKKIDKLISSDKKYEFLRKDRNHIYSLINVLKDANVNSQYNRDSFQQTLKQYLNQYLGKFYVNPTIQVPKVDYPDQDNRQKTKTPDQQQVSSETTNRVEPVQTIIPSFRSQEAEPSATTEAQRTLELEASEKEDAEWESIMDIDGRIDDILRDIQNGKSFESILQFYEQQHPLLLKAFTYNTLRKTFNQKFTEIYQKHFEEIRNILGKAQKGMLSDLRLEDGSEIPGSTDSEKVIFLLKNIKSRLRDEKYISIVDSKKN